MLVTQHGPGLAKEITFTISPGTTFTVMEGPVRAKVIVRVVISANEGFP